MKPYGVFGVNRWDGTMKASRSRFLGRIHNHIQVLSKPTLDRKTLPKAEFEARMREISSRKVPSNYIVLGGAWGAV